LAKLEARRRKRNPPLLFPRRKKDSTLAICQVGYRRPDISPKFVLDCSAGGYLVQSYESAQFLLESTMPECIRLRIACFLGIFWI
jgi:hypothetical protein